MNSSRSLINKQTYAMLFCGQAKHTSNSDGAAALQNKYEAQRAALKNGMVLCGSVMIGVQPLTSQHQSLFDGNRDEDPGMKVPESKIEPPQLPTGKVRL